MFEFVRTHKRILQFVLVLLIFPSFVFFGIQGYTRLSEGANATVAKVAGRDIKQGELDAAHKEQIEMLRRQMPGLDARMFDSPQMKRNTLDGVVREHVLMVAADKSGFVTTDERILQSLRNDREFAPFRNADGSLNKPLLEQALAAQGMNWAMLEQRMRQEIATRQVQRGLSVTVLAPATAASSAMDAMFQQREVQLQRFNTQDYIAKVNPSEADVEAYYKDPAHSALFQTPEKVDIEYVVLDLDTVKKGVTVGEDEVKKQYNDNLKAYTVPEERRAAHILVKAGQDASADDRAKAKAKAEGLLAELTKSPASFADVARKNSQDSGTAEKGGDTELFVQRGDVDQSYADALFALKKAGDLSPVVESKDGYYILQLKATKGGETRSFDSVRAEIEQDIKTQRAQAEYSKIASDFSNLVYEQSDSLKPAAEKLKLELRTAKGLTRAPAPDASGPLASAKLLEVIFGADSLRNKRNVEAMETAPNTMVSARVVNHLPAALPPLAEVQAKVREKVVAQQAAALARKEGEARLAAVRQAPATDLGSPAQVVSRASARELPRPVVDAVLRAPSASLPAVAGVDLGDEGYVVAKVVKVLGRDPIAADAAQAAAQYVQSWGAAESQAYYAALKSRYKVEVMLPAPADAASGVSTSK